MRLHAAQLLALALFAACHHHRHEAGTVVPDGTFERHVAVGFLFGDGERFVVAVPEDKQGHSDLNGDGDAEDFVLHVYDVRTEQLTNLGLAAAGYPIPSCPVCNREGGEDHAVHAERLDLVPPPNPAVHQDWIAFFVGEAQQGLDLNGDGDQFDQVLHVFDLGSRRVLNLGFATTAYGDAGLWFRDGVLLFAANEFAQGTDLDGDGLVGGVVTYRYDLRAKRLTQLTSGTPSGEISGTEVALHVAENAVTGDLNGDGRLSGPVLHVYDLVSGLLVSSGLTPSGLVPVRVADLWIFGHRETDDDLNGNGELDDVLYHTFDPGTGVTRSLDLELLAGSYAIPNGETVMLAVSEFATEADLNGDGDTLDSVAHLYRVASDDLTSTGLATSGFFSVFSLPQSTLLAVDERSQGADLDANGALNGEVLHEVDLVTGLATNLGVAASPGAFRVDRWLVFPRAEYLTGDDWNGDGDTLDRVLFLWDGVLGLLSNTGWAGHSTGAVADLRTVLSVHELEQGEDLNGDGDQEDPLSVLYDVASGAAVVLPFGLSQVRFAANGTVLGVVGEMLLGVDLNGDGDEDDQVLQVVGFGSSGG